MSQAYLKPKDRLIKPQNVLKQGTIEIKGEAGVFFLSPWQTHYFVAAYDDATLREFTTEAEAKAAINNPVRAYDLRRLTDVAILDGASGRHHFRFDLIFDGVDTTSICLNATNVQEQNDWVASIVECAPAYALLMGVPSTAGAIEDELRRAGTVEAVALKAHQKEEERSRSVAKARSEEDEKRAESAEKAKVESAVIEHLKEDVHTEEEKRRLVEQKLSLAEETIRASRSENEARLAEAGVLSRAALEADAASTLIHDEVATLKSTLQAGLMTLDERQSAERHVEMAELEAHLLQQQANVLQESKLIALGVAKATTNVAVQQFEMLQDGLDDIHTKLDALADGTIADIRGAILALALRPIPDGAVSIEKVDNVVRTSVRRSSAVGAIDDIATPSGSPSKQVAGNLAAMTRAMEQWVAGSEGTAGAVAQLSARLASALGALVAGTEGTAEAVADLSATLASTLTAQQDRLDMLSHGLESETERVLTRIGGLQTSERSQAEHAKSNEQLQEIISALNSVGAGVGGQLAKLGSAVNKMGEAKHEDWSEILRSQLEPLHAQISAVVTGRPAGTEQTASSPSTSGLEELLHAQIFPLQAHITSTMDSRMGSLDRGLGDVVYHVDERLACLDKSVGDVLYRVSEGVSGQQALTDHMFALDSKFGQHLEKMAAAAAAPAESVLEPASSKALEELSTKVSSLERQLSDAMALLSQQTMHRSDMQASAMATVQASIGTHVEELLKPMATRDALQIVSQQQASLAAHVSAVDGSVTAQSKDVAAAFASMEARLTALVTSRLDALQEHLESSVIRTVEKAARHMEVTATLAAGNASAAGGFFGSGSSGAEESLAVAVRASTAKLDETLASVSLTSQIVQAHAREHADALHAVALGPDTFERMAATLVPQLLAGVDRAVGVRLDGVESRLGGLETRVSETGATIATMARNPILMHILKPTVSVSLGQPKETAPLPTDGVQEEGVRAGDEREHVQDDRGESKGEEGGGSTPQGPGQPACLSFSPSDLAPRMRDLRLQAVQLQAQLSRVTGLGHVLISRLPPHMKARPDVVPLLARLAEVEDAIVATRRGMMAASGANGSPVKGAALPFSGYGSPGYGIGSKPVQTL